MNSHKIIIFISNLYDFPLTLIWLISQTHADTITDIIIHNGGPGKGMPYHACYYH